MPLKTPKSPSKPSPSPKKFKSSSVTESVVRSAGQSTDSTNKEPFKANKSKK